MKDGVNPLRPSHIECTGPCDRGERHYDEFALAGRSTIAVAVVGLQRGSRYRSGVGLIAGSTARVRRTSASALTCNHVFPRSRSASDSWPRVTTPTVELVGAAAAVYRHSDDHGSASAAVSAPT